MIKWNQISQAALLYQRHGSLTDGQLAQYMNIPAKNAVPRRRALQALMLVRANAYGQSYTLTPLGRRKAGTYIKAPSNSLFKERARKLRTDKARRRERGQVQLFA